MTTHRTMADIGFDNTLQTKERADAAEAKMNFVDRMVDPIASIRIGEAPVAGDKVYNVRGMIPGILRSVEGENGSVEIKTKDDGVFERWVRMEDIKASPWTDEEKEQYFNHRKAESERSQRQEKEAVNLYDQRVALRKQFTGR